MPKPCKRPVQELPEVFKVSGDAIGQAPLEVRPDPFIGIELRGVSREVKGLDSWIASKEFLGELGLMERAAVPEKDERSSEVAREVPEELPDLFAPKVLVGVKACVEAKPLSLRRDRDGGDGRDFAPASCDNEGGRFSFDRPGPLEVGNEREPALIQEDQAGPKPFGLFLYAAKRGASSVGSLAPAAPWPVSAASDSSSPGPPLDSRGSRYNNLPGSFSGRPGRYASGSKGPSSNRLPGALSPRRAPRPFSAPLTKAGGVPDAAWILSPTALSSGRLDANAPRSLTMRPLLGLPSGKCGPALRAGRRDAAFVRVVGVCHEVSLCPPRLPLYDRPKLVTIE